MPFERESVGLILLGSSTFPLSNSFSPSEAFLNAKERIKNFFIEKIICVDNSNQILDLFDLDLDPNTIDVKIGEFISNTKTPFADLFIYYVGHGGFDKTNNFLLAIKCSRDTNLNASSITVQSIGTTISNHANQSRIYLILDCCFAAEFAKQFQSGTSEIISRELNSYFPSKGFVTLCSSSKDKPSEIVVERKITMFTEALTYALSNGSSDIRNQLLSFRQIKDLTFNKIRSLNPDHLIIPEIHTPKIPEGDISDLLIFQNFGFKNDTPNLEDAQQEFFSLLKKVFREEKYSDKFIDIIPKLNNCIPNNSLEPKWRDFYRAFEKKFKAWFDSDRKLPVDEEICDNLIFWFDECKNINLISSNSLNPSLNTSGLVQPSQAVVNKMEPGSPRLSMDNISAMEFKPVNRTHRSDNDLHKVGSGLGDKNVLRMLNESQEFILGEANTDPDFFKEARKLRSILNNPISLKVFMDEIRRIGDKIPEEKVDMVDSIVVRFKQCWETAPEVKILTRSNLLVQNFDKEK